MLRMGAFVHSNHTTMSKFRGNKNIPGLIQKIINHIPVHDVYGEYFFGGGDYVSVFGKALNKQLTEL